MTQQALLINFLSFNISPHLVKKNCSMLRKLKITPNDSTYYVDEKALSLAHDDVREVKKIDYICSRKWK